MSRIADVAALESVIGRAPPMIDLKVIDHLDPGALHWLRESPLAFVGVGGPRGLGLTIAGGERGFARGDAHMIEIPAALIDDPGLARGGVPVGTLFIAPGIGETLRVNGRLVDADDARWRIEVEECYVHCAKALIRSDFWKADHDARSRGDADAFLADCRFLALATVDAHGHADLSPKGDPAGTMAAMLDGALLFADRPGNRRADSHRNIVANPRAAALLVVPGSDEVLTVSGEAELSADPALRAHFMVQGKQPLLVTRVSPDEIAVSRSAALNRARLWPTDRTAEGINAAGMFAAHVKLNRDRGLAGRIAGAVMSVPGLMQRALEKDYRDNLY